MKHSGKLFKHNKSMKETEFIDELMCHILEGVNIPKVQVERAINPILSLFIESILNKYFENNDDYSGEYQLISPEFPLKKDNNQSTNIDYLLVNNSKKVLVFFELKTDVGSLNMEQMNKYLEYKEKISELSAVVLKYDLDKIHHASKGSKYSYIISHFDSVVKAANDIRNAIIIYLVPNAIMDQVAENEGIDFSLSYNDLPKIIDHKFQDYWFVIRKNLIQLDNHFKRNSILKLNENPLEVIVRNIKEHLSFQGNNVQPRSFQTGIKGKSNMPNYQVNFEDGSIKTFRFNGTPRSEPFFNPKNLSTEYLWDKFSK